MHTDPDLPPGWRRKVVKRMKDNRYDVYIFSPEGKRFRSKKQLKEFLDNNERLNLNMDQFSFSLTKDKHGPKHRLTKLQRPLKRCDSQQKCKYYPNDNSASPASPIPPAESLLKYSPPQTTIILQPWSNFMIRVFSVPPVDQGYVSNEAVKDAENVEQESQPVDVKNFVRKEALKTLLSICESEKDDVSAVLMNTDSEERPLTELEELDLYYDFDYDKDKDEINAKEFDVRRVFDSDSDSEDEDSMMI